MALQPSLDPGQFQDTVLFRFSTSKCLQDEGVSLKPNPPTCQRTTDLLSGSTTLNKQSLLRHKTLTLHLSPMCYTPCNGIYVSVSFNGQEVCQLQHKINIKPFYALSLMTGHCNKNILYSSQQTVLILLGLNGLIQLCLWLN
jgi:hypothetical protein